MSQGDPPTGCIQQLVEEQADRIPDAVAFQYGSEMVHYHELDERANWLAHVMHAAGLRPRDRVGVCLERGPSLVVALLAVLKAGCAYVPLDPGYPHARVAFMAADSAASLILTHTRLRDRFADIEVAEDRSEAVRVLCLDKLDQVDAPNTRPDVVTDPDDLSYLIYTSGSTGRPKGVAITHHSAVVLLHWIRHAFSARELSGVLAATSVCFDLSIFEIFGPLSSGGRFILVRDVLELASLGQEVGVRLVNTVPSAMSELLGVGGVPDSVETVCLAGEPLTQALARRVWRLPCLRRLFNLYGPSEDTTYSTYAEIPKDVPGIPPIGRPLPYTTAYVLDEDGKPVLPGVPGELYLAGAGLARGYLNQLETAARFLPDPFDSRAQARMYRTGDRVRLRPDGQLEFIGRVDDQVKIRGYRIELGEITAALTSHPGLREATVIVLPGPAGDPRLVAYAVAADGAPQDDEPVLAQLRQQLPGYMMPAKLIWLERMPTTPNGKVDRTRLPPPRWGAATDSVGAADIALNETEAAVAAVWREVLGLEAVGPDADFFALGGDSLLATRVAARLRAVTGTDLSLTAVFDHSTVAELAAYIRETAGTAGVDRPENTRLGRRDGASPLSFAQQRMWFLHRLDPGDTSYVISYAVLFSGAAIEPDRLRAALADVVIAHEALRTSFWLDGDTTVQRVQDQPQLVVAHGCLDADDDLDSGLRRLSRHDAVAPFDLARLPLLRCRLVRHGVRTAALLLTVHHIVFDAWSFSILVRDLGRAYEARGRDEAPKLAGSAGPTAFAARQRRWLDGPDGHAAVAALTTSLRGVPQMLALPTDLPRPAVCGPAGGHLTGTVGAGTAEVIRRLARQHRLSLYMVGLAAFVAQLWQSTGGQDLLVGSAFAGRTTVEAEDAIGCFVNMMPIRLRPGPDLRFIDLLEQVRTAALFVAAHQNVPFESVLDRLRVPRSLAYNPLVQVAFGVNNVGRPQYRGAEVSFDGVEFEPDQARLDLTLWLEERDDGLRALWTYRTELFHADTVAMLHRNYTELLRCATAQPERSLAELVRPLAGPGRLASAVRADGGGNMTDDTARPVIRRRPKERALVAVHREWDGRTLPALVRANVPGVDLSDWVRTNRSALDELARTAGGVLLRGFGVAGVAEFSAVMNALSDEVLSYGERSSPRSKVTAGVYTSTDHPADQPIVLHNEQSYTLDWPLRIVFYCHTEPEEGGCTPLADSRKVLARLDAATVAKFERLGVLYVRNYLKGISLPWQEVFQTDQHAEVEEYCAPRKIECEWVSESHLRTRQVRSAVHLHPHTGERTWFNHALFFHVTSLPAEISAGLRTALPQEDLPYHTYYGDGTPIENEVLAELRAAYTAETTSFIWRHGDILLVENMLAAHGREPFRGNRRILVAMTDPVSSAHQAAEVAR